MKKQAIFTLGQVVFVKPFKENGRIKNVTFAPDRYGVEFEEGDTHWFKERELTLGKVGNRGNPE